MTPEQIVAQIQLMMAQAVVGSPPRFTVEQGYLLQFTMNVIQSMAAEIQSLKGGKRE